MPTICPYFTQKQFIYISVSSETMIFYENIIFILKGRIRNMSRMRVSMRYIKGGGEDKNSLNELYFFLFDI